MAAAQADGGDAVTPKVTLDTTKLDGVLRPTVEQVTADAATPATVTRSTA